MMKTIFASATFAAALATFVVVGCGSSTTTNNGNGPDSGAGTSSGGSGGGSGGSGSDSGGVTTPGFDAGPDGSPSFPPLPDGSVLPHGNQLVPVPTGSITLNGVTSDDYAVYTNNVTNVAYAVSLAAGSTPISLGTVAAGDVYVIGKVVFLGTTDTKNVGAASVWTSGATAPAPLATATYVDGRAFGVSSDGSHVIYLETVDTTARTASLVIAGSDGSAKTTVVQSLDLQDVCYPVVGFAGTTALATYCPLTGGVEIDAGEPDGGTNVNVGVVTAFAPPSWTPVSLATSVQTVFSNDPGDTKVAVNGAAGTQVVPITGGTPLTLDATGAIGSSTYSPGLFTSDGSHLIYTTTAMALERAATTAPPAPVQLAGANTFSDTLALSPDTNWVLGTLTSGQNGEDLYLSSAATAGTPVKLTASGSQTFSDNFTVDSSHVLFFSAVNQDGSGTLAAQAVTGGGTATTLGSNAAAVYGTAAAKVIFNSNVNDNTGGTADLQSVDLSASAAPTVQVTQADPVFFLNHEKTTIVYTWSYTPGTSSGLWTLPVP